MTNTDDIDKTLEILYIIYYILYYLSLFVYSINCISSFYLQYVCASDEYDLIMIKTMMMIVVILRSKQMLVVQLVCTGEWCKIFQLITKCTKNADPEKY